MDRKHKVLFLEDEGVIRQALSTYLSSLGLEVLCAEDAKKAFQILEEHHDIDLAIIDNMLPGMTGLDFLRIVKPQRPGMIAVVYTARDLPEVREQFYEVGADDFLVKGTDRFTGVGQRVRGLLKKREFDKANGLIAMAETQQIRSEILEETMAKCQEKASRERNQFETMFSFIGDGIALYDPSMRLIWANSAYTDLFKHARMGMTCPSVISCHVPSSQKVHHAVCPRDVVMECPRRRCTFSCYPCGDALKDHFVHVVHDITAISQVEEALVQSERKLSIRNRIANVFLTADDEEVFPEVLEIVLKTLRSKYGLFGYIDENGSLVCPSITEETWDQCRVVDRNVVFPREKWSGIWGMSMESGKSIYSNEPFDVPEGHIPIVRALDVPIVHRGGVIGNLLVANKESDYTNEDVATLEMIATHIAPILKARLERDQRKREREAARRELATSERKLKAVFDSMGEGLTVTNLEAKVIQVNREVVRMHGYPSEGSMVGLSAFDLIDPSDHEKAREGMKRTLEKGTFKTEYNLVARTGRVFPGELTASVLRDDSGAPVGFVGITKDITERRLQERAQRKLVESETARQRLEGNMNIMAGVAHELRTPLSVIQVMSQFKPGPDKAPTVMEKVGNAATQIGKIIRNMSAFSKTSREEDLRLVNVRELIVETIDMIKYAHPLKTVADEQILMELESLGDTVLMTDPVKIQQIVINMMTNAAYAIRPRKTKGRIKVSGRVERQNVLIIVTDNGVGMDEDTLRKHMDPFYTTRDGRAEHGGGQGLGCSIIYAFARELGGSVSVKSEEGKGTAFVVRLPMNREKKDEDGRQG